MSTGYTAHDLTRELLDLTTARAVTPDQFLLIATKLGIRELENRIFFLTQLKEQLRLLPLKLYPTPEARARILDALTEALDGEIAKEEAA
jgi:type III secretion system TyeA family effector delivery regulator